MKTLFVLFVLAVTQSQQQQLYKEPTDFICPEDDPTSAFSHEFFCDKFYECKDGVAQLVTCEDGLGFDKLRRYHAGKCDDFANTNCGNRTELQTPKPSRDGVCPRQHGRFTHPDPEVCNSYVVCKQGKYVIKECSNGLQFDPLGSQCTWPTIARREGCQIKKKKASDGWVCPDEDFSSHDPTQGTRDPNPRYHHPTQCDKFYVCIGGVDPRINACPYGLAYDLKLKRCDDYETVEGCETWYDEEPAAGKKRERVPPKAPTSLNNASVGLSRKPVEIVEDKFECPLATLEETEGKIHPRYPHPTDCTKFYVCIDRTSPRLNRCGQRQVFNLDTLECDQPANVADCKDWFDV